MRAELVNKKREQSRKTRIRKKIRGLGSRPRLTVFRSNLHIYAQIIDDANGKTLISASEKEVKTEGKHTRAEIAEEVGKALAQKALKDKVAEVAFDKGSYKYHGRVKALAEGARKGGLKF